MSQPVHNELHPQLLGIAAVNPFVRSDAAARQQMVGSHVSQALVIEGAETRRHLGGFEQQLGTTTFSVKMPVDAEVLHVIDKYPRTLGGRTAENPYSLIIYEDIVTKEIGVLEVPTFHCLHQHFGFRYDRKVDIYRLREVRAGTVIADTPAKDNAGNAQLGIEANVAFMSIPAVIEDGVVVSRSFARRMGVMGYEKRDISFGQDWYPLNLYGDENSYKIHPDIGEFIDDTGLLFGLRKFDENMDVIGMSPRAVRTPDHNGNDRLRYGDPGARVVDVSIIHEPKGNQRLTPVGMDEQTIYYYEAERKFNKRLIEIYTDLKKVRRDTLRLSLPLTIMIEQAMAYVSDKPKQGIKRMYQHQALDEWRVEVTYEYLSIPTVPFKLTCLHGGKGVIVAVWEDEWMPVDAEGNRADLIMDTDSTIKRMNVGRMYEQYNNAASRTVSNHVRALFGLHTDADERDFRAGRMDEARAAEYKSSQKKLMAERAAIMMGKRDALVEQAWNYLMGYYEIVSPWMHEELSKQEVTNPRQHVTAVLESGVYLFFPSNNPVYYPQMVQDIRTKYPVHMGPVTYHPDGGDPVVTETNVLIGSLYIILLEKTGGDHSGVSSAKTQHFGIPACLTKYDKYASAARSNPVRIAGESEVRLLAATIGGEKTAELLDLSCSPASHKAAVRTLLRSPEPTNVPMIVNREETPMGGNRALNLATHMLECNGIRFTVPSVDGSVPQIYRDLTQEEDIDDVLAAAAAKDAEEDAVEETKKPSSKSKSRDDDEESEIEEETDEQEED